jgi:hypothetical protein
LRSVPLPSPALAEQEQSLLHRVGRVEGVAEDFQEELVAVLGQHLVEKPRDGGAAAARQPGDRDPDRGYVVGAVGSQLPRAPVEQAVGEVEPASARLDRDSGEVGLEPGQDLVQVPAPEAVAEHLSGPALDPTLTVGFVIAIDEAIEAAVGAE